MARLNTRTSATPQVARSSTIDSLYRDSTPSSRLQARVASTARQSSYSVASPAPSATSDKENQLPSSRDSTPKPKGNRAMGAPRLPTPVSGSASSSGLGSGHSSKRRRTDDYSITGPSPTFRDDNLESVRAGEREIEEDDAHNEGEDKDEDEDEDDEDESTKFYDPQQDPDLRRELRANIRKNHRDMEDNRDELIKPDNNLLLAHMRKQDYYMGKVKQTADAALDSRAMVLASDLANRKINNSLNGNNGVGIDVDQFVSRCILFMTSGGDTAGRGSGAGARSREGPAFQEDDEDENGDGLDWAVLGREACFPCSRRPPVSSFLLGPLSVQKRARATQTRRARSQRQPLGPATRPQELTESDMQQSENSNLSHMVEGIRARMRNHINVAVEQIEAELNELEGEADEEDEDAACRRRRVQRTTSGEPAVSLFDFAVNPNSFGQTVENLFYVSFLIREGHASVDEDKNGLPLLIPSEPFSLQEQRERKIEKHQAVFRIDWPTWKDLIEAFDIQEPLIPHRAEEESDVAPGGWYG